MEVMVRFVKVEGAGNDYVLVDGFAESCDDPSGWSRVLADRHQGVGSDGLLLVEPAESGSDAVARMRIFNADGSEGRMCGNGLRCVVRWLVRSGRAPASASPGRRSGGALVSEVLVDTASGPRRGRLLSDEGEGWVEVSMGRVSYMPEDVPVRADGDGSRPPSLEIVSPSTGSALIGYAVSVGNPHLVVAVEEGEELEALGRAMERHAAFPEGVNLHLVHGAGPAGLTARTWERGSGATRACGTGAVACAAIARELGWCRQDVVEVRMPGGALSVRLDADAEAFLAGPARLVFRGEWGTR